MNRQLKEVSGKSYVATSPFNADIFKYATSMSNTTFQTTGSFSAVPGATAVTCPAGRILRENGKKLYPGANPGVTTLMVGVFDNQSMLSGFIDPNSPKFAVYNTDRPLYLKDAVDPVGGLTDQGPPVLTNGTVVADGQVRSSTLTVITTTTGTITLNPVLGQVFRLTTTLTGAITLAATAGSAAANPGAVIYVIVSNGGGQTVIGDQSTIKTGAAATVTNAKSFSLKLVSDGSAFYEVSRTQHA